MKYFCSIVFHLALPLAVAVFTSDISTYNKLGPDVYFGQFIKFFGYFMMLTGISALVTSKLFNMPVWIARTRNFIEGKKAVKYGLWYIAGGALIMLVSLLF